MDHTTIPAGGRKCSNCRTEIELKDRNYRSDLMFCSIKCNNEFMNRDSKLRKKLGWEQLRSDQLIRYQCDNCGVVLFYPKKVEPLEHGKWIEENGKLCDKVCDGKLTTAKEILEAQQ